MGLNFKGLCGEAIANTASVIIEIRLARGA